MSGIWLEGTDYVEKGIKIVVNCTTTGADYRPKGVDWFKDGNKLKSDGRILITESVEEHLISSTLEIERSVMTDAGTYVCRGSKDNVSSKKIIVLDSKLLLWNRSVIYFYA